MITNGFRVSLAVGLCLTAGPVLAQSHDFDSLSLALLAGQDGWTSPFNSSPNVVDGSLYSSVDTTHVVRGSNPGASVGLRLRGAPSTVLNSSGLQTDASLGGGSSLSIFALANSDADGAFSFGLQQKSSPSFFFFRRSTMFAGNNTLTLPMAIGSGSTDWYRLLVNVDFLANGGDGSASMFVKDLTLGQTNFTPIAGMQDLNLGLTASNLANNQVSDWTQFEIRVDNSGMLDNISAGQAVNVSTPEPGSLLLFSASLMTCTACLVRHRRTRKTA